MGDNGEKVQLYVYDLSNGLARQLSPMLLKKQVLTYGQKELRAQVSWGPLPPSVFTDRRHLAHSHSGWGS